MSEFPMREINIAPGLEEIKDLGFLPREDAVYRVPTRCTVCEAPCVSASLPTPHSATVQLQHGTRPAQRPVAVEGVVDKSEQAFLDGPVDAGGDWTVQPQLAFPRRAANSMACSTIVFWSRETSALRPANSDFSALDCFRPGLDS